MFMNNGIAGRALDEAAQLGLSRRSFLFGSAVSLGALGLAGCANPDVMSLAEAQKLYGPAPDEKFPIPAVDVSKLNPKYYRKTVRYGANVGRQGFLWSGEAYVGRKAEWPVWTPPKEMIQRQPEAAKYASGMAPGLDNPLGARVLYLYQNGVYTLYTIYSTSDPETIGTNLTSGCTGLLSQDMLDLYARTPVKTKVVVLAA